MDRFNIFITGVLLFGLIGTLAFGLGLHEIDLAFNMKRNAFDIAINGSVKGTVQVWRRGLKLLMVSVICFFISILLGINT